MIGAAAAYMSGLFFASFFTEGSDFLLAAGLFPLFYFIARKLKWTIADIAMITVIFTSAVTVSHLYTNLVYEKVTAYNGAEADFVGTVTDIRYHDGDKATYTCEGRIEGSPECTVTYYGDDSFTQIGDRIKLKKCLFEMPENDYLFSSKDYYKARGIYLTSMKAESVEFEHTDSYGLRRWLLRYKNSIVSDFSRRMGVENGAILSGIVFGETSDMDETSKTLMYRCGIGHVLAVSGLHVSIMAFVIMLLLDAVHLNRIASFCIMNVFLMLMIIIVDSPVSAIRAAIMLNVIYSARIFRRQSDTLNSLAIAVLVICISHPYSIMDSGFILSVAGTYGIGVFAPYITKEMKSATVLQRFIKNFISMLCVMLVILPFSIIYFDETSIISPLTNIIIVPLCSYAMVIGMVYAISGGLISMLSLAGVSLDIVKAVTELLGSLEFAHFSCSSREVCISAVCGMLLTIAVYAIFRSRRLVAVSAAGAVAVFAISSALFERIRRDSFTAAVLGKGTNAAVVITYEGRTDIFDLSGHYKSDEYVQKYLSQNGISEIGTLTLTDSIQSQYSSYTKELELVKIGGIFCAGDTGDMLLNEKITSFGENIVNYDNGSYSLRYESGRLDIFFGQRSISFMHARGGGTADSDVNVFYGNISENKLPDLTGMTVCLDLLDLAEYRQINNFEIIISEDGEISIRRL